ncbi:MAG: GDP-mannose 4,6-dehydratase, partial [Verrucomicrobia bacterium]|nr:GDP-mannose 4,6-dehydratase [Verrucomicrobiota bacterium]
PDLTFREADVTDLDAIAPLFDGVDWVFHLAALADIVPSVQRPLDYHKVNVDGTMAVLEAARAASVCRFVYVASSSCYGIPDEFPTPETAPIRPMHPYAITKYVGEQYVLSWAQIYKMPCISMRLFNVYGPRSRTTGVYGAVFGVFLAQKLANKPLTVVGNGRQTRDFVFVKDVVDAFVMAAQSDVVGEAFNVGTGSPSSINCLVELLGGEVIHLPKRPGEPDSTQADITKITKTLGWRPTVGFDTGVKVMLDHINDWRDAPVWNEGSISRATREWFAVLSESSK